MTRFLEELNTQARCEPPSPQALERCLRSLPDVRRKPSLLPLLRLQLSALPRAVYLATACLLLLAFLVGTRLNLDDMQLVSGTISAVIVLILGWQLLLSGTERMAELEHTCKYGFGQILLARIVCLFGLSLLSTLLAALALMQVQESTLCHAVVMVLPTVLGALSALLWHGLVRGNPGSMILVYGGSALLTAYHWEFFFRLGQTAVMALAAGAFGLLLPALWNTAKRRINCEAYGI